MIQIEILATLFFIALIGFIWGRTKILPSEIDRVLNSFVYYVSMPAAIFLSLATMDKTILATYPKFIVINSGWIIFSYAASFLILKLTSLSHQQRGSLLFTATSGNAVFLGFPLLKVLGQDYFNFGVMYAILAASIGNVAYFTFLELDKNDRQIDFKKQAKDLALNPILLSAAAGFIFLTINQVLPELGQNALNLLGTTTTPLALFSFGVFMAKNLKIAEIKLSGISTTVKLIVLPALTWIIVKQVFKMDPVAARTSIIQASMPTAIFSLVIADMFNLDKKIASSAIILSAILFIFTSIFWLSIY